MISVLGISWHALKRWYFGQFHRLSATVFTEADLPAVQGFNCGDKDWETYISDWLTSGKALADMKNPKRQTRVWLFRRWKRLVGFGSLGITQRPIPAPDGPYTKAVIIPFVAVQIHYQSKPKYALIHERYGGQIMNHLIFHAREYKRPYLVLYVDPENSRAKGFYEKKFGFSFVGLGDNGMEVMALRLS